MKGIVTAILVLALVHYIAIVIYLGYISDTLKDIEWNVRGYKGEHEKSNANNNRDNGPS